MVDEEAIRLPLLLAVLPQGGGDGLALLPGVDEHQALLPPGVLKDIGQAGVGVLRGLVRGRVQRLHGLQLRAAGGGLHILDVKMLHAQPPFVPGGLDPGDEGLPPGAHGKEFPAFFRVADGGGQADAPGIHPGQAAEPLDQA